MWLFGAVVSVVLLFTVFNTKYRQGTLETRIKTFSEPLKAASLLERTLYWKSTLSIIADRSPFGAGTETFYILYPRYKDASLKGKTHFFAHNDYLQIIAELGVPGFFFLLWFLVAGLRSAFVLYTSKHPNSSLFGIASIVIICGFIVSSLVEFGFYVPGVFSLILLVIAFCSSQEYKEIQKRPHRLRLIVTLLLSILMFIFFCCTSLAWTSQYFEKRGKRSIQERKYNQALLYFKKAVMLCPLFADRHVSLAFFDTAVKNQEGIPGISALSEEEFRKAIELSPYTGKTYALGADLYLSNFTALTSAQKEVCLSYILEAGEIYPYSPLFKRMLATYLTLYREEKQGNKPNL